MMRFFIFTTLISILFFGFLFSQQAEDMDSVSPVGLYTVKLPSADGMGRVALIHIFANGNAMRSNIYIGKPKGDYIEEGVWKMKGKTLIVTLTIEQSKAGIKKNRILKFKIDGNKLIATQYDEKPFGKKEIKFTKIPE
ncbi:copper resistance protein NlpE N-terminal domain-containing protein [bacterium]|nr:copper resistance protein NlpE N-terminal domain-containing protein [bacterium]